MSLTCGLWGVPGTVPGGRDAWRRSRGFAVVAEAADGAAVGPRPSPVEPTRRRLPGPGVETKRWPPWTCVAARGRLTLTAKPAPPIDQLAPPNRSTGRAHRSTGATGIDCAGAIHSSATEE